MKKVLLLCLILAGCVGLIAPPETIRNEKCLDFDKMKVFQITNDGILAHLCPDNYPSYYRDSYDACVVHGDLVWLPVKKKDNDYVDEQKVQLPNKKCFMADGVYRYTTRQEIERSVRKIKIADANVANPAFAEYQRQQAEQLTKK